MQFEYPKRGSDIDFRINNNFARDIGDPAAAEARADQIQSDARISVKLQEAIERGHWPDLTREQCERLLSVLTEAML